MKYSKEKNNLKVNVHVLKKKNSQKFRLDTMPNSAIGANVVMIIW